MATATLTREVSRLRAEVGRLREPARPGLLDRLRRDPSAVMTAAGLEPDPWQVRLLSSRSPRKLVLCSRQSGKSTTTAALALRTALLEPGSLVLLLSPTLRQSGELFRAKVLPQWRALGCPCLGARPTQLELHLSNGSRIISLPGEEGNIRGYSSVALLVIDEAARVPDALYYAVRPMLAVSGGALVGLSSAWAKISWFYEEYTGSAPWERTKITADQCPRISREFLEEERESLGPRWFSMEYLCEFGDAVDAVFRTEDIEAALANDLQPLFGG